MSNRREKNKPRNIINKQLEQPGLTMKEKDDNLIQLGKFFYSLAGMTYAGVILTVLIDFDVNRVEALYWGTLAMALLTILAWKLVKLGNIKR